MDIYYNDVMNWYYAIAGQRLDMDGKWGPQCTDGAKHWAVSEFKVPNVAYGNGRDVAKSMSQLPGWTFVGPDKPAQAGDVVSWDEGWGWLEEYQEYFGHVAVVVQDLGEKLEVIQQNPKPMHKATVNKNGLVGYARPPRPLKVESAASVSSTKSETTHTIKAGETYWSIARMYGTTPATLQQANPDKPAENLYEGLKIKIPAISSPISSDSNVYHTVRAGETLWAIAKKYSTTVDVLKKLNPSDNYNVILVGDKIRIK